MAESSWPNRPPNASGPAQKQDTASPVATRFGSHDAYFPYERDQKSPSNPVNWIAILFTLGLIGIVGHRFGPEWMQKTAPAQAISQVTAPQPAEKSKHRSSEWQMIMLDHFDRYVDQTEKSKDANPQNAPELQKLEESLISSTKHTAEDLPDFVALMGTCYVSGNDVHFILPDGKIITHLPAGAPLDPLLTMGRAILQTYPHSDLRVLVFKDRLQVIGPDGKIVQEQTIDPANAPK